MDNTQLQQMDSRITQEPESLTENEFQVENIEQAVMNLLQAQSSIRELSELMTKEMADTFDINLKSMVTILESVRPKESELDGMRLF